VAFTSLAANLVPGDTNATGDVFVRHLRAGATERASTALGGGDSNGVSQLPSVSPDGSMVAFASRASNLVAGDGSGWDVFAHSLSVDADPPAIVCAQADGAWHDANVTLACTAVDTGSGLADPSDATFTLRTSVSPGVETTDAATNSHVVCDVSGNCATAGPVRGNRIDLRAPGTACAGGDGGWHAGNVSIACAASDAGSGLAHGDDSAFVLSTSVPDGQESADAATSDRAVCDAVGNCAQAGPIGGNRVDRRAPSIAIAAPVDGAAYVLGGVAAASYSCADGGSGVATCTGPVPRAHRDGDRRGWQPVVAFSRVLGSLRLERILRAAAHPRRGRTCDSAPVLPRGSLRARRRGGRIPAIGGRRLWVGRGSRGRRAGQVGGRRAAL
jgi:hypothetical protein